MKNVQKIQTLLLVLLVSTAMILGSCKKDDKIVEGDKTALTAKIVTADALSAKATATDYPQAAIDTYKSTLAAVKTTAATSLTQVQIDNLVISLNEAMALLNSKAYGFIDESQYLNAGWHFDEGTGTTATAFSTVKHVATFVKGNTTIMGSLAALPTWVDGLKSGKAIHYSGGGHLEVPYTTAFLPVNLSISVWIKPDELYENNYIVSQNFWGGYKLQTQSGGKPFFTYKKADGGGVDADNETDNSIKINVWNHIVITLNSTTKELKFFVNGTLTKTWTESVKGIGALTQALTKPGPQPFLIGCVATDNELVNDPDTPWMDWGQTPTTFGYFKGTIDELKIYNTALADGQVSKLYNDEKP